ncbi:MAG: MFS transporter [Microlunatus sp.]|nr:MFS transporter [Microlunatus sp.]
MEATEPIALDVPTITEKDVNRALWICFFAWTFAVYDFVLFGNLLPKIAEDLGWTSATATGVNTWVTAGTAIVAFGIGPVVDSFGRKKGIVLAVLGAAFASLLTPFVGWVAGSIGGLGLVLLVIVRSIAGLGYAEQAINATYLNELFAQTRADPAKARRRGIIYSLVQSGWPIGSVLAAVSVYLLFPIGGWELCFFVAVFPAIFIALTARYLKESPQFAARHAARQLLEAGRAEEAHQLARQVGVDLSEQSTPVAAVFKGQSLRPAVFIGIAFLLSWLGVLAFVLLGTLLLTAEDGKNITFNSALTILIISNATAFVGYLFHGWLGDQIGRRNAIAIGWVLSGLSFTAMLLAPNGDFGLIIAFYSAGLFFLIGPYSALLFFNAESFPVHTRATGGSLINAAGQVGAIIGGVLITASLNAGWSWTQAGFIWGCIPVFLSGLVILGARNVDPKSVRFD